MQTAPTPVTTAAQAARPAARRSVWGCLTCRRRKVKCQSRDTPCEACRRLHLACTPSFGSNIKHYKRQRPDETPSCKSESASKERSPARAVQRAQPSPVSPSEKLSPDSTFSVPGTGSRVSPSVSRSWSAELQSPWEIDVAILADELASYASPDLYSIPVPFASTVFSDGSDSLETGSLNTVLREAALTDRRPDLRDESAPLGGPNTPDKYVVSQLATSGLILSNLGDNISRANRNDGGDGDDNSSDAWDVRSQSAVIRASIPRPDDDNMLVVYYKRNLSSFFSVKSANSACWNFYSYAIQSVENQPESPLRHSILAWTAAHLIVRNQCSSGHMQFRHYAWARAAVDDLHSELAASDLGQTVAGSVSTVVVSATSRKLRMLLSTSLFLGYCDILSGDNNALVRMLADIKQLLESDWPRFMEVLGPLEARILVWLAYLDLRSNLWTTTTTTVAQTAPESTALAPLCSSEKPSRKKNGGLFRFLVKNVGLSALRSVRRDRHYLAECFGSALPQEELEDDLVQEPAKILSDDIMAIFDTLRDFAAWIEEMDAQQQPARDSLLLGELRSAKIQAIQANIARMRAESKVVHAELLKYSSRPEHVMRSEFHRLVTAAMCLSATIILNRIVAPKVRTDEESQAAAREIIQIARTLHESGYVCWPRSLVWPMPLFVAGIEVTDRIYQDWVLNYLLEVASWGTSTKKARELLRRIIERQEAQNARVKVGDVIRGFGEAIMI